MSSTDGFRVTKSSRRSQTCDLCKSRHQKCNGARPQCNNCELRNLGCIYSGSTAQWSDGNDKTAPLKPRASAIGVARTQVAISDAAYAHLRDQLLDDILRGIYSNGEGNSPSTNPDAAQQDGKGKKGQVPAGDASLSSFHQEISHIAKTHLRLDELRDPQESQRNGSIAGYSSEPPILLNFQHARKILQDSLPKREVARRLLNMFLDHQNSIFYVCKESDVQAQLDLMYECPERVSLAWFCQMFLIFSVGIQFDDVGDRDGATYHEIGRKYMDEALGERHENKLWVIRAMLLICFYQPPMKWTTLWIYLDTAIRRAQRYQLDLGQNSREDVTDEEYLEWRQLWLTVISFDRWVAIFLGRLPHIKESISRDRIFKDIYFEPGLEHCVLQTSITRLAIIVGYILRDVYISGRFTMIKFQGYKTSLAMWIAALPSSFRQQVESGFAQHCPQDIRHATVDLHFMYLGAYIILARPLLVEAAKATVDLPTEINGLTTLDASNEAKVCTDQALRLINSSTSILLVSLPPKRVFLPVFFLVYAIHFIILGIFTKLSTHNGGGLGPDKMQRLTMELTAVDAGIQVLQFCGQQNPFARKYSFLVKELRQQLEGVLSNNVLSTASSPSTLFSGPSYTCSQVTSSQNLSTTEPISTCEHLGDALSENDSPAFSINYEVSERRNTQDSLFQDVGLTQRHLLLEGLGNVSLGLPWSAQDGSLGQADGSLSPGSLLNSDMFKFLENFEDQER